jgi:hypothetical protein
MLWSLLKEHKSLRGVVAFYDTGATFQADDPHACMACRRSAVRSRLAPPISKA